MPWGKTKKRTSSCSEDERVEDALVMVAVAAVMPWKCEIGVTRGKRDELGMVNTGTVHHSRIELPSMSPVESKISGAK